MNLTVPLASDVYPTARFDEVLRRVERKIDIDDQVEYATVGVRWYGNGAFIRERLLGADIARKRQWIIRTGDVVYNKLFAWKGAFAVADHSVDGNLVSDKFPTYAIDDSILDVRFLSYYFRTSDIARQAERLSKGAAAISKLTLNPPQFWELTIPLPPIDEQRRLAATLADAEGRISEARRLRAEASAEADALVTASIDAEMSRFDGGGRLADVLTGKPRNGWSAPCDNADGGTPVLKLGAVTGFTYRSSEFKRTSEPTTSGAHYWLEAGDLLITRSNTERLVGHVAIYDGHPHPCIYPDLMMRVPVDVSVADTRFVYYWLRTRSVRELIEAAGSGTSSTMKKITQGDVMGLPFPIGVTVDEQSRVVERLDKLVSKINALRTTQRSTADELEALLHSVIARAFHERLAFSASA